MIKTYVNHFVTPCFIIFLFLLFLEYLVTSRGPGTAFAFALTLLEILIDKATKDKVANGLLYD